jgi:hypothetical protein
MTKRKTISDYILEIVKSPLYRLPNEVTEYRQYGNGDTYSICPTCNCSIDRDYIKYCSVCGQRLEWIDFRKMTLQKKK